MHLFLVAFALLAAGCRENTLEGEIHRFEGTLRTFENKPLEVSSRRKGRGTTQELATLYPGKAWLEVVSQPAATQEKIVIQVRLFTAPGGAADVGPDSPALTLQGDYLPGSYHPTALIHRKGWVRMNSIDTLYSCAFELSSDERDQRLRFFVLNQQNNRWVGLFESTEPMDMD